MLLYCVVFVVEEVMIIEGLEGCLLVVVGDGGGVERTVSTRESVESMFAVSGMPLGVRHRR